MPEIYVSTDVETDGPIPGPHSMLSIGSAAYTKDKTLVGTYTSTFSREQPAIPQSCAGPRSIHPILDIRAVLAKITFLMRVREALHKYTTNRREISRGDPQDCHRRRGVSS